MEGKCKKVNIVLSIKISFLFGMYLKIPASQMDRWF
jgi:hypothetical protein